MFGSQKILKKLKKNDFIISDFNMKNIRENQI